MLRQSQNPLGFSYSFLLLSWKIIYCNIIGPDHKVSISLNFVWVEISISVSSLKLVPYIDYKSGGGLHWGILNFELPLSQVSLLSKEKLGFEFL